MNPAAIDLDGLLRRLHLPTIRRNYQELSVRAEEEDFSYRDYLALLVAEEVAHRGQTRIQRAVRQAHFPVLATIEEFDFTFQTSVKQSLLGSFLGPELVAEGRSLILCGPSGVGKTHLAIAIAYRAIQNGGTALFREANALIEELSFASLRGTLKEAIAPYLHVDVLVIDELGYLTYPEDAANVLFQVVNQRSLKRRSVVITTNKPLDRWARVLHDADLAEAIVDRVLERGRLIELRGTSYRTRHLQRPERRHEPDPIDAQSSDPLRAGPRPEGPVRSEIARPVRSPHARTSGDLPPEGGSRLSGIPGPEFPEPTTCASSSGWSRRTS